MATSQAGIDAAYATEINNCTFREDAGVRRHGRAQAYCGSVDFESGFSVNGVSYTPALFTANGASTSILSSSGDPITIVATPPTPPVSVFKGISVTGTADFNNVTITGTATGVFDAGSY